MTFRIHVTGAAAEAVATVVPQLVADKVASGITALDPALWGPDAEAEASKRLGWTEAVAISRPLVAEIVALREELHAKGVDHIVLGGMGGSSLAPEVITRTAEAELTVLDSTDPGQVLAALRDRLEATAVVISSKSGSTLETDSQRRVYEKWFREAGIDPRERIVVVTDPGSPLDQSAREAGYRVFNADPNVGGRYSALTAFGLVPSGLAGVDISELLDEADATQIELAVDNEAVVPVGKIVRIQVTGADVIHKFTVPSFGIKIDAIPGRLNETWFQAEREGIYYGQCSFICGQNHAFMPIAFRVVSQERYAAWLNEAKQKFANAEDAGSKFAAASK